MSAPHDGELSAMLEARADRMPASAEREILADVRDEMRAPSGTGAFAVVPVAIRGRGAMPGAGWAAAALVAVVALAVAGGLPRSPTTPASTVPVSTGSPTPASPGSAAPPGESSGPGIGSAVVSIPQLRQALTDSSLDGRLVLVDSTLRRTVVPCPADTCPPTFGLDVVGPVVTDSRPAQPAVPAQPGSAIGSLGGTWVVVPYAGTLVLVGRLADPIDRPVRWSELTSRFGALILDRATALEPIAGWLVAGSGGTRVVTEGRPLRDGVPMGAPQAEFALAAPALGIDPHALVTGGPFLVRLGPGAQPEIVARYEPGGLVTVAMPRVECAEVPSGASLRCEDAVAAALAVVPTGAEVTSVEFGDGTCPSWARCAAGPPEVARGHVVVHLAPPGPDLWVVVVADDAGAASAWNPIPFPDARESVPSAP